MYKKILLSLSLLWIITFLQAQTPDGSGIVYVKPVATGTGSGNSWANATADLQGAINAAGVQKVFVAVGNYNTPAPNSFVMKSDVAIYGGFDPGSGITNLTHNRVLPNKGMGDGSVLNGNNQRPVIWNDYNGLTSSAVLDGFTITGGYGNTGAGVHNAGVAPSYLNLVVKGNNSTNFALGLGGGMHISGGAAPGITHVIIQENRARNGGGIYMEASSPVLNNVVIRNNNGYNGGGMHCALDASVPELTNVSVTGNQAATRGGGIYNDGASIRCTNMLVTGNDAAFNEGGIWNNLGFLFLINTTIVNNESGAINNAGGAVELRNAIVYGSVSGSNYIYRVSLVEGRSSTSDGNVDATNISIASVFNAPASGDYTLKPGSPAINRGDNAIYINLDANDTDLAGNARNTGGRIDLGAYESSFVPIITPGGNGVVYVRTASVGNGTGTTWGNATSDLQGAINATGAQKVFVASGTYTVGANSYIMKNNVEIYGGFDPDNGIDDLTDARLMPGTGGKGSVLDGNNTRPAIWNVNNGVTASAILDGFTITNAAGNNQAGIYNINASPTLSNLLIRNNNTSGIYNSRSAPVLTNVAIVQNTAAGVFHQGGHMVLNNVTIAGNTSALIAIPDVQVNTAMTFNNSIVFGTTNTSGVAVTPNYSLMNPSGLTPALVFANPSAGDYTLRPGSAAMNAGSNALFTGLNAGSKDLLGRARLTGGVIDMGAYEYDPVLPVLFGRLSAVIRNGRLIIDWRTETETDNDHFLIQVSADGRNWKTVQTVQSTAPSGSSVTGVDYHTAIPLTGAGLGAGFLLLGIMAGRRQYAFAMAAVVVFVLSLSCNKRGMHDDMEEKNLLVRIVQVDKDGRERMSKVVRVVRED
ncbi:hypothetical protein LQ567_09130 [Niabella pedocola]|uniref:Right handed beta helix domain-containing protein n=1 Tax=Niabella pedocola TaxID=1752077 RepID=A0ABS8PP85_9BACT|nr:choice-of-anchor Q domain-containing protein [Niabella pedocola]MCD2422922.1 hypothetical protein [Niabella pedocola]